MLLEVDTVGSTVDVVISVLVAIPVLVFAVLLKPALAVAEAGLDVVVVVVSSGGSGVAFKPQPFAASETPSL